MSLAGGLQTAVAFARAAGTLRLQSNANRKRMIIVDAGHGGI